MKSAAALLLGQGVAANCCWCDTMTPANATTTTAFDGTTYRLVMSDEFEVPNRSFDTGKDTRWTAIDIGDDTNNAVEYYTPSAVTTVDGNLQITTLKQSYQGKNFTSGMVQGFQKFCFTGGVVEVKAKVPDGGGFWPAIWLFGNLGRAVFRHPNYYSDDGLWPWSFDACDPALQQKLGPGHNQRISACDNHSLAAEGLNPFQGRGCPEVDLLEAWNTNDGSPGQAISSMQLAARVPSFYQPAPGTKPTATGKGSWYHGVEYGKDANVNVNYYGPNPGEACRATCQDAISATYTVPNMAAAFHTYRLDWAIGPNGHLRYFIDGDLIMHIPGSALGNYTDPTQPGNDTPARNIPEEPMYLLINTAIGQFAGGPGAVQKLPGLFKIDYVRVYQDPSKLAVGCDTIKYPTAKYIANNPSRYGPPALPLGSSTCPNP